MKIKEIEKRTGIQSANIRYYEKEGLLHPERNEENNYRDYSETDVQRLEQIKILRLLGISIEEIKELYMDERTLEEVITTRLEQLDKEERRLKEVRATCENILKQDVSLGMLNINILEGDESIWDAYLKNIWKKDMTEVAFSGKVMNRYIAGLLIWGYFLNVLVSILMGGRLVTGRPQKYRLLSKGFVQIENPSTYQRQSGEVPVLLFYGIIIGAVILGIAVYWSAKLKTQIILFHICALGGTPVLKVVFSCFAQEELQRRFSDFLPKMWLFMIVYILVYLIVSELWKKFYDKDRYTMILSLVMTAIMTAFANVMTGELLMPFTAFLVLTIYVGLFWTAANRDNQRYNWYYAMLFVNRILNPIALCISFRGRTSTTMWR